MQLSLTSAQSGDKYRIQSTDLGRVHDAIIVSINGTPWVVVDYIPICTTDSIPEPWCWFDWEKQ